MKEKNKKHDPKAECMVRAIGNGNNVKAYKCLESLVRERIAKKINDAIGE